MADEPSFIAGVEKRVAIFGGLVGIVAAVAPVIVTFARLDPAIQANASAITRLEATVSEDRKNVERENGQQNERVSRIEESRSVGLQRLSKVEEAVQTTKDTLAQINGKLDRVLMRR